MKINLLRCFIGIITIMAMGSTANSSVSPKVKEVTGKLTFSRIIEDLGFSKKDVWKLLTERVVPKKMSLVEGERYLVLNNERSQRLEARFYLEYTDEALIFWKDKNGNTGVDRVEVDFETKLRKVEGKIVGSLLGSVKAAVDDDWPAFRFFDAFIWDVDFKKRLEKNAKFNFLVEEKYDHGKFIKFGEILKAELQNGAEVLKRVFWQNGESRLLLDPDSKFETRPFYAPVNYLRVSSLFSNHRLHPVKHRFKPHLGVDFALPEGSPVYAARAGVIDEYGKHRGNGNFIRINHEYGFSTMYNHLSGFVENLKVGQHVNAGDLIGYVGCTGYCTNSHLHFTVRKGDYLYDPVYVTKPYPYQERAYFQDSRFVELKSSF